MLERRWSSVGSVCWVAGQTRARFAVGQNAHGWRRFKIDNPELLQRASQVGGELDDDELIVARHVTAAGRSRAYLGGAQVPAGVCAELTAVVRIYGQSEQERLTEAGRQLQLLDRFAGAAVLEPLSRTPISGLRIAPHGRGWHNFAPRLRAGPARSICCASAWKRSSESDPARRRMSSWRQRPCGCSPQTICGIRRTRLFRLLRGRKMRLVVRWRCCTRRARRLNLQAPETQQRLRWRSAGGGELPAHGPDG